MKIQPRSAPPRRASSQLSVSTIGLAALFAFNGCGDIGQSGVSANEDGAFPNTPAGMTPSGLPRASDAAPECSGPGGAELPRNSIAVETGMEAMPAFTIRFPPGYRAIERSIPEPGDEDLPGWIGWLGRWSMTGGREVGLAVVLNEGYLSVGAGPGDRQIKLEECQDTTGPGLLHAASFVVRRTAGVEAYYLRAYRDLAPGLWLVVAGEALGEDELRLQLDAARSVRLP